LKGMSATMGYEDLADLTHKLENVFDAIRNDSIDINAEIVDVLFEAVDALNEMVEDISNGGDGIKDIASIVELLEKMGKNEDFQSSKSSLEKLENSNKELQTIKKLDEFELSILNESIESGYFNYEITVVLRKD